MAAFGPQVLDGDEPRWARVVLAGQSQVGGMAACNASTRNVVGKVMFSGGWVSDCAPAGRRTRMVRTRTLLARRQPASTTRPTTRPARRSASAVLTSSSGRVVMGTGGRPLRLTSASNSAISLWLPTYEPRSVRARIGR